MKDGLAIRIRIDDAILTARLRDVPSARDLLGPLPLTLTFRDLNGVEKISELPGDDPEWPGIVRLGRFDGSVRTGDLAATVEVGD